MLFSQHKSSGEANPSEKLKTGEPKEASHSYSFFNPNSPDVLTLNNLAYNDPMHKQLHAQATTEPISDKSAISSYSLFNKNFTTFVKYTESNIDINMALSSSLKNDSHMESNISTNEEKFNTKELRLNDMLAATSLTKEQENFMDSSKLTDYT